MYVACNIDVIFCLYYLNTTLVGFVKLSEWGELGLLYSPEVCISTDIAVEKAWQVGHSSNARHI